MSAATLRSPGPAGEGEAIGVELEVLDVGGDVTRARLGVAPGAVPKDQRLAGPRLQGAGTDAAGIVIALGEGDRGGRVLGGRGLLKRLTGWFDPG